MITICACGEYEIEQETARYQKGEKPMCHEETCRRVRERKIKCMTFGQTEGGDNHFDVV